MDVITFIGKLHKQNGFSFYLPTKIVKWLKLDLGSWNHTLDILKTPTSEPIHVSSVSVTRHRDTWKGSFYSYGIGNKLQAGKPYLLKFKPSNW